MAQSAIQADIEQARDDLRNALGQVIDDAEQRLTMAMDNARAMLVER